MGAGLAAAAGTMAAGMATSMGASLAVSGMVSTAAGAAFTSLVSQATVSLVNNQGDLGETFRDMGESQVWQNVAFAAVTAGVTGGVDANAGFGTQAVQLVEGAAVRSAAQSAIYGTNFGETFVDNLKTGAVYAIGANIAQGVGTWYHGEEYTAQQNGTSVSLSDDLIHISAHAAIGCGIGAAISDNCAAGAAGAAAGELGAEWSNNATVGKMSGAFAGLFTDSGAEGVYLGYDTASNAVRNNWAMSFGYTGAASGGGVAGVAGNGIVVDDKGNYGQYSTLGMGVAVGASGTVGWSFTIYPGADTIFDYKDRSNNFSTDFGLGLSGSFDVFQNPSFSPTNLNAYGYGFTIGTGVGSSVSATRNSTIITKTGNIFNEQNN